MGHVQARRKLETPVWLCEDDVEEGDEKSLLPEIRCDVFSIFA